jgi:hypothetical protein
LLGRADRAEHFDDVLVGGFDALGELGAEDVEVDLVDEVVPDLDDVLLHIPAAEEDGVAVDRVD